MPEEEEAVDPTFRWGDLPPKMAAPWNPSELESLCRPPRPLHLEGPKIYQPISRSSTASTVAQSSSVSATPPIIRHGIHLQNFIRSMSDPTEVVKMAFPEEAASLPLPPPITPFSYSFPSESDQGPPPPLPPAILSRSLASKQLFSAVCDISAFVGFKTCSKNSVQVS